MNMTLRKSKHEGHGGHKGHEGDGGPLIFRYY